MASLQVRHSPNVRRQAGTTGGSRERDERGAAARRRTRSSAGRRQARPREGRHRPRRSREALARIAITSRRTTTSRRSTSASRRSRTSGSRACGGARRRTQLRDDDRVREARVRQEVRQQARRGRRAEDARARRARVPRAANAEGGREAARGVAEDAREAPAAARDVPRVGRRRGAAQGEPRQADAEGASKPKARKKLPAYFTDCRARAALAGARVAARLPDRLQARDDDRARNGEIAGLGWSDVSFTEGELHIRQQFTAGRSSIARRTTSRASSTSCRRRRRCSRGGIARRATRGSCSRTRRAATSTTPTRGRCSTPRWSGPASPASASAEGRATSTRSGTRSRGSRSSTARRSSGCRRSSGTPRSRSRETCTGIGRGRPRRSGRTARGSVHGLGRRYDGPRAARLPESVEPRGPSRRPSFAPLPAALPRTRTAQIGPFAGLSCSYRNVRNKHYRPTYVPSGARWSRRSCSPSRVGLRGGGRFGALPPSLRVHPIPASADRPNSRTPSCDTDLMT